MSIFARFRSWLQSALHVEQHPGNRIRDGLPREAAGLRLWDELRADVRYGLRQLRKDIGFAGVIIISLAVGVGAATALFSVIYVLLISPLPYRGADRIVRLNAQSKAGAGLIYLNGPQIRQLRQSPAVESLLAVDFRELTLTGRDLPENVHTVYPTANTFDDLGVPAMLGRGLGPSDAIEGQEPEPVAVLGYNFWQKKFLSDPDILGKTLQMDRKNYVIVGVASSRFGWYEADVYLPLKLTQDPGLIYLVDLRLRSGVTLAAANAALQPQLDQFARDNPKQFPEHFSLHVDRLNKSVEENLSGTLYLLFGAVMMLLAIGCGNVSILLMARGTARQHELAVRVAIGAPRRRIVRQLLTESLLLASIGVALGVLLSYGILEGIQIWLPPFFFAPEVVFRINLPVLLFSGGVALSTGIVFGLWPALQLSRTEAGPMIQSNVRRAAVSIRGRRTHNALVAGQIALTLLLLAGAGSAMQGFQRLLHTPLGYDPHDVLSVGISLRDNDYTTAEARGAYFEQLRAKVAETPGVTVTAISDVIPPRSYRTMRFEILGKPASEPQIVRYHLVSPGYFGALRIPLLQGWIWTDAENDNSAHVVLINRTLAQRYFPDGDAIGQSIRLPGIVDLPPKILSAPNAGQSWLPIVGIVEDTRNDGLRNPIQPEVFVPYTLMMRTSANILVRSKTPGQTLLRAVRAQVAAVNPEQQTFSEVQTLESEFSHLPEWRQEHSGAWILAIFATLAVALGAVGLYSVVSYTVAQRTNEFGIRIALGAQRGDVLQIVFAATLASVGCGMLAGLSLTLALNTILARWVSGNPHDPMILVAAALLLSFVSGLTCAIPAWRASKVDPLTAIHCE